MKDSARECGVSNSPLGIFGFNKRKVFLDLLQRPARTHQRKQVLYRETVPADAGLPTHLVGLERDAVRDPHGANVLRWERGSLPSCSYGHAVGMGQAASPNQALRPGGVMSSAGATVPSM
jgi:hypothetical protein